MMIMGLKRHQMFILSPTTKGYHSLPPPPKWKPPNPKFPKSLHLFLLTQVSKCTPQIFFIPKVVGGVPPPNFVPEKLSPWAYSSGWCAQSPCRFSAKSWLPTKKIRPSPLGFSDRGGGTSFGVHQKDSFNRLFHDPLVKICAQNFGFGSNIF